MVMRAEEESSHSNPAVYKKIQHPYWRGRPSLQRGQLLQSKVSWWWLIQSWSLNVQAIQAWRLHCRMREELKSKPLLSFVRELFTRKSRELATSALNVWLLFTCLSVSRHVSIHFTLCFLSQTFGIFLYTLFYSG